MGNPRFTNAQDVLSHYARALGLTSMATRATIEAAAHRLPEDGLVNGEALVSELRSELERFTIAQPAP